MATDRLKIYNGALRLCRARAIASLTVNEEARRLLDNVWNDGGVRYCLERGQWRFAMRATMLTPDPAVTPSFGYPNAYPKPTDWIDTSAVCQDEFFNTPLTQYADEVGYWFASINPIYVKYVSDDPLFGSNLSNWPVSFTEYVKAYFASQIVGKLAQDESVVSALLGPKRDGTGGIVQSTLVTAKNRDAMAGPTTFPAQGSWTRARMGRGGRRGPLGDGGSPGSLIG